MPGSIRGSAMPESGKAGAIAFEAARDDRISPLAEAWASLLRHKAALCGALILAVIAIMAVFSPWIAPYDPAQQIPWEARRAPLTWLEGSGRFVLFGTDHLGRDLLSRIVYASRVTLIVSFIAVAISGCVGLLVGVAAGYLGGWVDAVCMRLVDIFLAFPFELLALSIVAVTGPSLSVVVIVIALRVWVVYARVVLVHVLPIVLCAAIVIATLYVGRVILFESALSFLGVGVPSSTPTWGGILGDGRSYIDTAWWIAFFPGLAIMITVLGVNLLGDWVRDYLDPRIQT